MLVLTAGGIALAGTHPSVMAAPIAYYFGMTNTYPHTRLVRSIARLAGTDAEAFQAEPLPDGSVHVYGPGFSAFYPVEAWTTKFARHLHQGYFNASLLNTSDESK